MNIIQEHLYTLKIGTTEYKTLKLHRYLLQTIAWAPRFQGTTSFSVSQLKGIDLSI